MADHVSAANTNFRADYCSYLDKLTPDEQMKMMSDPELRAIGVDAPTRMLAASSSSFECARPVQNYNRNLMFDHQTNCLRSQHEYL